jgi:hypothetical protein
VDIVAFDGRDADRPGLAGWSRGSLPADAGR